MLSVDTIRAYTYTNIDSNHFIQDNWGTWFDRKNNTTSYYKKIGSLLFWYYPTGILLIKFSLSKFMNGSNAIPFDLNLSNIAINLLTHKIQQVFPHTLIEPFENWMCSEIHPFVHLHFNNASDKMIHLEAFKKTRYSRLKKRLFPTGIQVRNGSHSLNIYSKRDEIEYRLKTSPHSVSSEDLLVIEDLTNVIRFEYQKKKRSMQHTLKNHRMIKDVLNESFCKEILLGIIKSSNLHIPFVEREELIDTVKYNFSRVIANNLIEFIFDFNERDQEYLDNKYPYKTQGNYLRKLRDRNINPVFLSGKVSKRLDLTNLTEPAANESLQFNIKLFLLIILLMLNRAVKTIGMLRGITYIHLISEGYSFYYEDGG